MKNKSDFSSLPPPHQVVKLQMARSLDDMKWHFTVRSFYESLWQLITFLHIILNNYCSAASSRIVFISPFRAHCAKATSGS